MKKIFCLVSLLLSSILFSQVEQEGWKFIVTHENDIFGINNEDENYTGGLNLEFQSQKWDFKQPFFTLTDGVDIQKYSFGVTAHTPQDLESITPVLGDRPYSSLMYLGFGLISRNKERGSTLVSNLIVGLVGHSAPGKGQSHIHKNNWLGSTRPVPLGWHNQIGKGGALVMNYSVKYFKNTHFSLYDKGKLKVLNPSYFIGGEAGNYMMNLETGVYIDVINFNNIPSVLSEVTVIPKQLSVKRGTFDPVDKRTMRSLIYMTCH